MWHGYLRFLNRRPLIIAKTIRPRLSGSHSCRISPWLVRQLPSNLSERLTLDQFTSRRKAQRNPDRQRHRSSFDLHRYRWSDVVHLPTYE